MLDFIFQYAGLIGLLFFFITFVSVASYVLRPSKKQQLESYKNIPLFKEEYESK